MRSDETRKLLNTDSFTNMTTLNVGGTGGETIACPSFVCCVTLKGFNFVDIDVINIGKHVVSLCW